MNVKRFLVLVAGTFFCTSFGVRGGTYERTTFVLSNDNIADSNMTIVATGIGLGVNRREMMKIFGDTLKGIPSVSNCPDVVIVGDDTVDMFFVDTAVGSKRVVRQRLVTSYAGLAVAESPVKVFDLQKPFSMAYLHIDKGENGYLASCLQQDDGNKPYLYVNNGTSGNGIDTSGSAMRMYSSQCAMAGDTFAVIYTIDDVATKVGKVYSKGSAITLIGKDTVFTGEKVDGLRLLNCAIASDGKGTMLAVVVRGAKFADKHLEYRFIGFDLEHGSEGVLPQMIGDHTMYYYDDIAVVSYGETKFAILSWNQSGVRLDTVTLGESADNVMQRQGADLQFCAMAASNNYLAVAWIGDDDGNSVRSVEGIRYYIGGGSFDSAINLSYSDPLVPVVTHDSISTALNCAVDDSGTIALVWRNGETVSGCVWANRSIRHPRGFYRSPVELLPANNDSVHFDPVEVGLTDNSSWYLEHYLRYGATVTSCTTASWISFSDATILSMNRTTNRYYQYKLYLNRTVSGVIDSFSTPGLSSVRVIWNTQPRIVAVDSVVHGAVVYANNLSKTIMPIIARSDTTHIFMRARDSDSGDHITIAVSVDASPAQQLFTSNGSVYATRFDLHPFARSDTVYTCSLQIKDDEPWTGVPVVLRYQTANMVPRLMIRMYRHNGVSGIIDSSPVTNNTNAVIQEEDTIRFEYSVVDTNDVETVRGRFVNVVEEGVLVTVDSVNTMEGSTVIMVADTMAPSDMLHYRIEAYDPDTVVSVAIGIRVNHKPVIRGVSYNDEHYHEGDTARVVIDTVAKFTITIDDTDCTYGDTITYRYSCGDRRKTKKYPLPVASLTIIPDSSDTMITFYVKDRYERSDSINLYLAYPWLATDSIENPEYATGLKRIASGFSLIAGSKKTESVTLPLVNNGRDVLKITTWAFGDSSNEWVYGTVTTSDTSFMVRGNSGVLNHEVTIPPDSSILLRFHVSAAYLTGDSLRNDSFTITTNDPRHRKVSMPIRIEHNDLPQILSIMPYFIPGVPYGSIAKRALYVFPPHAVLAVGFSESIDTASLSQGIMLYSIFDMEKTGSSTPIPFRVTWLQENTIAHITPFYEQSSAYFERKPPPGLFIPTDSIGLKLTSDIVDRATTPSGPNALDVNRDFQRDTDADTSVTLRIDSISFTVSEIDPLPGSIAISVNPVIRIVFSSALYAASVDTSLENNRSFEVRSVYNNSEKLTFSSISADSISVAFTLRRELFYRDSVQCIYHSRFIRDRSGFAADNDNDGIDATMFDSLSMADDIEWGYRVRTISVVSVEPESAAVLSEVSPAITINFDGKIPAGAFDTDTSRINASFMVGSGRTGASRLRSVSYVADSTGVVVRPKMTFFSNDSVYCQFNGFSALYRYNREKNIPDDTINVFSSYRWYFYSGEIGFYTYPNPYKPESDARHCKRDGPCGIWFKNLHTLAKEIHEVIIRIYTMNAHPVFDSNKKGIPIQFSSNGTDNLPQWKWDTRNNREELVATGLYLFSISDTRGKVLKKGKLIIVR